MEEDKETDLGIETMSNEELLNKVLADAKFITSTYPISLESLIMGYTQSICNDKDNQELVNGVLVAMVYDTTFLNLSSEAIVQSITDTLGVNDTRQLLISFCYYLGAVAAMFPMNIADRAPMEKANTIVSKDEGSEPYSVVPYYAMGIVEKAFMILGTLLGGVLIGTVGGVVLKLLGF